MPVAQGSTLPLVTRRLNDGSLAPRGDDELLAQAENQFGACKRCIHDRNRQMIGDIEDRNREIQGRVNV